MLDAVISAEHIAVSYPLRFAHPTWSLAMSLHTRESTCTAVTGAFPSCTHTPSPPEPPSAAAPSKRWQSTEADNRTLIKLHYARRHASAVIMAARDVARVAARVALGTLQHARWCTPAARVAARVTLGSCCTQGGDHLDAAIHWSLRQCRMASSEGCRGILRRLRRHPVRHAPPPISLPIRTLRSSPALARLATLSPQPALPPARPAQTRGSATPDQAHSRRRAGPPSPLPTALGRYR